MPEKRKKKSIISRIRNNFFAGAVVLIPIAFTLYLTKFFITISRKIIPNKIEIKIGEFKVAEKGKISDEYNEEKIKEYMQWDSITIEVNLKLGQASFECYTCDFTHDYVSINADYRN